MNCEIILGGQTIGWAQIEIKGLYYHFNCQCKLTGELVYRLVVGTEGHWENLGVLVPENEMFTLRARLPIKRLPQDGWQIRATPCHEKMTGTFVAIYPEEPFQYLKRLEDAYLQTRDGQIGVVIKE